MRTAHCIVNLYRSVSRKEMTPSGYGDDPLNSILKYKALLTEQSKVYN